MGALRHLIEDGKDARKRYRAAPAFAPAGQSTQMIVGADAATDRDIVGRASLLYNRHNLRRIYYSAFSPIPDASAILPLQRPPLLREHRLYQSDWMMRFYGYAPGEVADAADAITGMLPLEIDPKLAWALRNRSGFPVDVNRAPREALLRVPGLGVKAVGGIISARRWRALRLEDVGRLSRALTKLRPFLIAADWRPTALADRAVPIAARQFELFAC
jgi:predicted DNA-binding helix-hairpin-helix protein